MYGGIQERRVNNNVSELIAYAEHNSCENNMLIVLTVIFFKEAEKRMSQVSLSATPA